MDFEFGETDQSNAFFDRHPKFYPAFERLMVLANKCFGRASDAERHSMKDVCFSLGHTCRDDYMEVLFLAVNGHGTGALKLLRGLYERAVTLAYIAKYPEKVDKFINFAAIQEFRALAPALELVTEDDFDAAIGASTTAAQIREAYEKVKSQFPGRAISWDVGLSSMVKDVGDPYGKCYLGSYTIPNFQVHATLASAFDGTPEGVRAQRNLDNADFALLNATIVFLLVIREQNKLFDLGLDAEIDECDGVMFEAWKPVNVENDRK